MRLKAASETLALMEIQLKEPKESLTYGLKSKNMNDENKLIPEESKNEEIINNEDPNNNKEALENYVITRKKKNQSINKASHNVKSLVSPNIEQEESCQPGNSDSITNKSPKKKNDNNNIISPSVNAKKSIHKNKDENHKQTTIVLDKSVTSLKDNLKEIVNSNVRQFLQLNCVNLMILTLAIYYLRRRQCH
jgi:hypothetical protein